MECENGNKFLEKIEKSLDSIDERIESVLQALRDLKAKYEENAVILEGLSAGQKRKRDDIDSLEQENYTYFGV